MALEWCKFALSTSFLITGILTMGVVVFGVNRFDRALNRMHAVAMGDTLGILFAIVGLMVVRGFPMDSLKLLLLILFLRVVSPVPGHMISRLEVTVNESLINPPAIDADEQPERKEESE